MFETSMVLAQPRPARSRLGLFTISLIAHSAVVVGAVAVSVASVDFPNDAPNEAAVFMPAAPPPPLGNPNGGAKPAAAPPVQKQQTPPPPNQITAPPAVPDEVPVADSPSTGDTASTGDQPGGTEPGPIGVPWGVDGGVGDLDSPPAIVNAPPIENKIYEVSGEVKAPVALYRVQPPYPASMVRIGLPATVVVRCVIDRNGNVRDPQLVVPAMEPFNLEVIKAVKQWKFKPGSLNGEAVEVYLDLKVRFEIKR